MDKTLEFLKGKKTYFAVAIALLYLAGVYLKFWEFDAKVILALGFGSIAALRSSIKNIFTVALAASLGLGLMGCANFSTRQTDTTYDDTGKPRRSITTAARAATFFSGKSELTKFRASQTDHSQGASVGMLGQEGGQTNQVADILGAVMAAAVKAAMK